MESYEELLSFLDLLDLDEEVIDTRLKSIRERSNYTNQHLINALQLLRYKHLINMQENSDCDNVEEFDFVAKLIKDLNEDLIDNVCKITNTVLKLNTVTLVTYSEHLLLQILSNINLAGGSISPDSRNDKALLYLKVCDSILDATIEKGKMLSMVFMETPLEEILSSTDEQLKIHFITNSVPKLVEGLVGYDILNRIWNYLESLRGDHRSIALKVLSSLSGYYLPVARNKNTTYYESTLGYSHNFWNILLYGLMSEDLSLRKISVYLAKRSIDYVTTLNTDINVILNDHSIFSWDHNQSDLYKNQWDNFFILIDSLEEKQSNIVLPSLQLFDKLRLINHSWLACAYNIGLRHDNGQVRLQCAEYKMKTNINSDSEAIVLLEALNDINFYENTLESKILKEKLSVLLKNESNLKHVLRAIPQAPLSPVPFYHLSCVLANLNVDINSNHDNASQVIVDILKASCNIITIREAIHMKIAHFVGKSCKKFQWKYIANIYGTLQLETAILKKTKNPILTLISGWELDELDKKEFYNYVTNSYLNVDIGMLYLENHAEEVNTFIKILNEKIDNIQDIINRQYSNKIECLNDVLYVLNLLRNYSTLVKQGLPKTQKTILQYLYCLLLSDNKLTNDETKLLFNSIQLILDDDLADVKDLVVQLYKTSVVLLQDPRTDLHKMVQSLVIVNCLSHNKYFINNYRHEMLELKCIMQLKEKFERNFLNATSLGRLRNVCYETHCKIVNTYLTSEGLRQCNDVCKPDDSKYIVDYVENVVDCGGYGCLEWILKIMNKTLEYLTNTDYNIVQFINRMWKEIEELKSSNQYLPCMMEFVKLITHRSLIEKPAYNNIIILYCSKIIEYGTIKNSPLYYLIDNEQLNVFNEEQSYRKNSKEYGHIVYILSEILLYCPVPRKDQRIADNLTLEILKHLEDNCINTDLHFNFTIQYKAIHELSKVRDCPVLQAITTFIMRKIDNTFKAKLRYHGNSQIHRTFQTALQHLLYILFLKCNEGEARGSVANWCLELLGRLPHQLSVRICLEWHVTLHFYMKKAKLDEKLLQSLQSKKVPLTSQFTIIYWLLKRKIANGSASEDEQQFVMETLLSHTMGQLFNIRLLAQFLSSKLNKEEPRTKYQYIIQVIDRTLEDNSKDKNYVKLKEDYFFNEFDIIGNLTPFFIHYTLPRLCDVSTNEAVDTKFVLDRIKHINVNTERHINPLFKEEWMKDRKTDEEFVNMELNRQVDRKIQEDVEAMGTIQKKYIPWKSMSDINVYNIEKKRESPSDLIVVASLIDKLPNLGGMARTSEVFGVKKYVIDSLKHLHDKQFQGLSVSAERWINVEEVRPGQPLKEYLNKKKAEGYSVVAAEQTSTSSKLQTFKFPKKTVLLLGHEKEGIPCDLLPMMGHCVEIPQQGFVRSLNVHVTAAIFVWEYARQHLL